MIKSVFFMAVFVLIATSVFADAHLNYGTPEGKWSREMSRLHQESSTAPRAKAWVKVEQNGAMIYEFTMRYEGGAEDGHGGVGIHILADKAPKGKSWGMGDSWLLWLNYDVNPENYQIPRGLSAQIYKSTTNSKMELVQSISLKDIEPIAQRYLYSVVPVKLTYLPKMGRVIISDPRGISEGWYVNLPGGRYERGDYVAVRTNGAKVSFSSKDVDL